MMKIEDLKVGEEYVNKKGTHILVPIFIGKLKVFFALYCEKDGMVTEEANLLSNFLENCKPKPLAASLSRDFDLIGKMLFKSIYRLRDSKEESQRFIISDNKEQAIAEMELYGCEYYTLDLIQGDISMVVLSEGKS